MKPVPDGPWSIVYADPPWDYDGRVQHGGSEKGHTSGAQAFYPTMKPHELREFGDLMVRPTLADKAILFMWTTGPQMQIAIELFPYWGFKYKTVAFVWNKERVNPGYYTMSQTEFCLVGTRGGIPKPRGARNVRQFLYELERDPEVISEPRTRHSAKPEIVRDRIDEMFPHHELRRVELFARRERESARVRVGCTEIGTARWHHWGNEVPE